MKVCVVGLGKLGQPLAAVLADQGHTVVGTDVQKHVLENFRAGRTSIYEPGLENLLQDNLARLDATVDLAAAVRSSELTLVVVPTPSLPDGRYSLQHVLAATDRISAALEGQTDYHVVTVVSTVFPGDMGRVVHSLAATSGRKVGDDLGVCYHPEFIALGDVIRGLKFPDLVLVGESDPRAGDALLRLYRHLTLTTPIYRTSFTNAEIAKIALNSFVTMKITFANTIARLSERTLGADCDVISAIVGSDPRVGSRCLRGGLGYGGPCFPRDNRAFDRALRLAGLVPGFDTLTLPAAVDDNNEELLRCLIERVTDALFTDEPIFQIGVLGLTYKPGTDVIEASQSVALVKELMRRGFRVLFHDPSIVHRPASLGENTSWRASAAELVESSDVIVLATPWPEYLDLEYHGKTVIDVWRVLPAAANARIVRLGIGEL